MIRWHKDRRPWLAYAESIWYAEVDGQRIADAVLTGRHGVDDYPWDWSVRFPTTARSVGVSSTLRHAKDYVDTAWKQRGAQA